MQALSAPLAEEMKNDEAWKTRKLIQRKGMAGLLYWIRIFATLEPGVEHTSQPLMT
jgi:hypothetical protein